MMTIAELLSHRWIVVLVVSAVASLIAFAGYGFDKWAARRGSRRVPENTLHLWSLLGGWPGALVAQQVFRHKTRKTSFQIVFWLTVVLNCAAVTWWLTSGDRLNSRKPTDTAARDSELPVIRPTSR